MNLASLKNVYYGFEVVSFYVCFNSICTFLFIQSTIHLFTLFSNIYFVSMFAVFKYLIK